MKRRLEGPFFSYPLQKVSMWKHDARSQESNLLTLAFTMLDFLNNIWTVFGGNICSRAQSSWLDVRGYVSSYLEEKEKNAQFLSPLQHF